MAPMAPVPAARSVSSRMRNFSPAVNVRRLGRSDNSGLAAAGAGTPVGLRPSSVPAPAALASTTLLGMTTRQFSYALKSKLPGGPCLIIIGTEGTARALVEQGKKSWYFVTADYAFGHSLEAEGATIVKQLGGTVVGSVRHPLGTSDFSSFLLQAQGSGAQVIAFANAGGDTINAVKQAAEFGITQTGQNLAGLLLNINDIHALGLDAAQGLMLTNAFYWDMTDETRAWSTKFEEKTGRKP